MINHHYPSCSNQSYFILAYKHCNTIVSTIVRYCSPLWLLSSIIIHQSYPLSAISHHHEVSAIIILLLCWRSPTCLWWHEGRAGHVAMPQDNPRGVIYYPKNNWIKMQPNKLTTTTHQNNNRLAVWCLVYFKLMFQSFRFCLTGWLVHRMVAP